MIRSSGKKEEKLAISMQELQQDNEELNRCQHDPVYFYNKYVRKEGQKVLTAEEYKELVKKRELVLKGRRGNEIIGNRKAEYSLTPADSILTKVIEEKIEEVFKEENHKAHKPQDDATSGTKSDNKEA